VAQRVFNSMMRIMQPANRGLAYSVLSGRLVAERTIFGFGCDRTSGSWIQACNTAMQYTFVLHCCDVLALCTASQISNKSRRLRRCICICKCHYIIWLLFVWCLYVLSVHCTVLNLTVYLQCMFVLLGADSESPVFCWWSKSFWRSAGRTW